jgi:hypothetical protein
VDSENLDAFIIYLFSVLLFNFSQHNSLWINLALVQAVLHTNRVLVSNYNLHIKSLMMSEKRNANHETKCHSCSEGCEKQKHNELGMVWS